MRTLCLPALFLAAMLALSLWTGSFVAHRTAEWTALLTAAEAAVLQGRWDLAEKSLLQARDKWAENQALLHIVMEHDDLESTQYGFAGALAACRQQDPVEFHILMAQLTQQLGKLSDTQAVSIKNIL